MASTRDWRSFFIEFWRSKCFKSPDDRGSVDEWVYFEMNGKPE